MTLVFGCVKVFFQHFNQILDGKKTMERNSDLKTLSQELRKNQTKEESLLWNRFLRGYPLRFRRQYIIGNYIADFYCHQAKLVVELDGSQHYDPEEQKKDAERTRYLEGQGLKVLRFSNMDVIRKFRSVCEAIDMEVEERTAQRP